MLDGVEGIGCGVGFGDCGVFEASIASIPLFISSSFDESIITNLLSSVSPTLSGFISQGLILYFWQTLTRSVNNLLFLTTYNTIYL